MLREAAALVEPGGDFLVARGGFLVAALRDGFFRDCMLHRTPSAPVARR